MNHHPQLSVSGLTFRYQDDNILKNLTMDFGAHRSRDYRCQRLRKIHPVYEPVRYSETTGRSGELAG